MTDDLFFKNKAAAFAWYVDQGGHRQHASFYAAIPADGKKVSRLAVSEMLRKEKRSDHGAAIDYEDQQRRLAVLDLREKELKVDKMEREKRAEDDRWLLKDDAHAQMAALFGLLRDSLRHHAHRATSAVIHLAGGETGRAAEVYEGIEAEIFAPAFNEVAGAGRVEVIFEGGEE